MAVNYTSYTGSSIDQHATEIKQLIAQVNHQLSRRNAQAQTSLAMLTYARDLAQGFLDRHEAQAPMIGQYEDLEVARALKEALESFNQLWDRRSP